MNVQQIMEDAHQMQNVQIQMEALLVLVILGTKEMVSLVLVIISFIQKWTMNNWTNNWQKFENNLKI